MWKKIGKALGERFRAFGQVTKRNRRRVILGSLFFLAAGAAWLPYDLEAHYWIWRDQPEPWPHIAEFFRDWGNFTDTVVMCALLGLAGKIRKNPAWRQAALTTFVAACCAGMFSNIFRFGVGRERPPREQPHDQGRPYIVHGPTTEYKYQSFPSGHSATSSACGTAMALTAPKVGWIALASGIMVIWSSVYDGVHYFSDCTIGTGIGVIFATLFAAAHRQLYGSNENEDPPST